MSADPRAALAALVTALERHLEAASARRGENDPTVVAAYQDVAEAFDRYDDALMMAYNEVTPLEIYSGDDDDVDEDDDFDDDGDDDGTYGGLDDEEYDDADDDSDDDDLSDDDDDDDDDDADDDDADRDDDDDDDDSDDEDDELSETDVVGGRDEQARRL